MVRHSGEVGGATEGREVSTEVAELRALVAEAKRLLGAIVLLTDGRVAAQRVLVEAAILGLRWAAAKRIAGV